jgi:chlorite dismutase
MNEKQLNHYGIFSFTDSYWALSQDERKKFLGTLAAQAPELAQKVNAYTIFPGRPEADLMIWSAIRLEKQDDPAGFFTKYARITAGWRQYLRPVNSLWGFTRGSIYAKGRSPQQLNAFEEERRPHLVVYPFIKTADWYMLPQEERQEQMNEHIKVGRQYPEITQLLLYSTGLQDQEFVVVYETDDLPMFSKLVIDLRATKARVHTVRDTPIYSATFQPLDKLSEVLA